MLKSFAGRIYRLFEPLLETDVENDYALETFIGAAGEMFQEVDELARDTDDAPGWSVIVDVDRVPAKGLEWLAQFPGVTLSQELTEDEKRDAIRNNVRWKRGTPAAMKQAIELTLTGTKTVILNERDTSGYHFSVFTRISETPDPAATEAALLSQKPGALQYAYSAIGDWSWLDVSTDYTDWQDVNDSFVDWQHVLDNDPI